MKIRGKGWDGNYILIDDDTNYRVELGMPIESVDGDMAVLRGGEAPKSPESEGKIWVNEEGFRGPREYYPSAFNLRWLRIK